MTRPVVFVGGDYAVADILDEVSQRLDADGVTVIRGRAEPPPNITEYPSQQWSKLFGAADIILVSTRTKLSRSLLGAAPRLRGLVFPTIGTDSVSLEDAHDLGLIIGHGPTPENFSGMAESTVMLMAALFLDLPGKQRITQKNIGRPQHSQMRAQLVHGRTIGLIGLGRIARAVVERLSEWGTRIIAYDPYVAQENAPADVTLVSMETLLSQSDLVSIHVTLTGETRHMVGSNELARMKPGAYLINTARGGAVDEQALIAALRSGGIGGAALDVFESEPLPPDSPLRDLDNVILTSHIVGHVREMHSSFVATAVENVTRILKGELPLYTRNPETLPAWRERLSRLKGVAS